jgi:hypothetical protein
LDQRLLAIPRVNVRQPSVPSVRGRAERRAQRRSQRGPLRRRLRRLLRRRLRRRLRRLLCRLLGWRCGDAGNRDTMRVVVCPSELAGKIYSRCNDTAIVDIGFLIRADLRTWGNDAS